MKRLVALVALTISSTTAIAADLGLDEVRELGHLNGRALACSQTENIKRIKGVMINHVPKSRHYGAAFEQSTQETFLSHTGEQGVCSDGPVIALKVENIASRLQALFSAGEKSQ